MKNIFRNNGLSIVLFFAFFVCFFLMSITGLQNYNAEQTEHKQPEISYYKYIISGSFLEVTMENMESEFLQMFSYILLTAFLYQRGSSESKEIGKKEKQDVSPKYSAKKNSPWPVKKGGIVLKLYENSLSIAFFILFVLSFYFHALGSLQEYNQQELMHGGTVSTFAKYMGESKFWFESFQNWQSEFFSIGAMVVLSIFLRQKGSPESKPVDSPHMETGS